MPTVLRLAGFRFVMYVDDHPPAHVHVFKSGGETVLLLGSGRVGPSVRENKGMARRDERAAVRILESHQAQLLREWRKIHG